jgi:hypothetical protein
MNPADIRQRQIAAIVDVSIDIQVVRPDVHLQRRGREQINPGLADQ